LTINLGNIVSSTCKASDRREDSFNKAYSAEEKLEDFIDLIYSSQMRHLASELLDYGLSPTETTDAVLWAITAVKSAGIRVNEYFMPLYTEVFGQMVRDCKMSDFGRAI